MVWLVQSTFGSLSFQFCIQTVVSTNTLYYILVYPLSWILFYINVIDGETVSQITVFSDRLSMSKTIHSENDDYVTVMEAPFPGLPFHGDIVDLATLAIDIQQ